MTNRLKNLTKFLYFLDHEASTNILDKKIIENVIENMRKLYLLFLTRCDIAGFSNTYHSRQIFLWLSSAQSTNLSFEEKKVQFAEAVDQKCSLKNVLWKNPKIHGKTPKIESFLVICTPNICEQPVLNLLCWPTQPVWVLLTHIITK